MSIPFSPLKFVHLANIWGPAMFQELSKTLTQKKKKKKKKITWMLNSSEIFH